MIKTMVNGRGNFTSGWLVIKLTKLKTTTNVLQPIFEVFVCESTWSKPLWAACLRAHWLTFPIFSAFAASWDVSTAGNSLNGQQEKSKQIETQSPEVVLEQLLPFRFYVVKIAARNNLGMGSYSKTFSVKNSITLIFHVKRTLKWTPTKLY